MFNVHDIVRLVDYKHSKLEKFKGDLFMIVELTERNGVKVKHLKTGQIIRNPDSGLGDDFFQSNRFRKL
jgi:hypothetical protein